MDIKALRAKVAEIVTDNPPADDFVSSVLLMNSNETDAELPPLSALVVADILERLHPQILWEQPQQGSNREKNQQSGATSLNNPRKSKKHSHQCSATDVGEIKIIYCDSPTTATAFISIKNGKEASW